ncbi:hypothetical protein HK11_09515 [Acetobacter sp. DmW_043]|nr:hypothetical protein HK11_09515 [Acetobacter sp. DmW_043]
MCQERFQYHAKPVFREQTGGEMLHDQRIEQIHADTPPLAGRLSLPGLCRAGIIAITTVFPCSQRHPAPAGGADCHPRQQAWTIDDPGCRHTRCVLFQTLLHLQKLTTGNNDRSIHRDHFIRRFLPSRFRFDHVERMRARIGLACQHVMNEFAGKP